MTAYSRTIFATCAALALAMPAGLILSSTVRAEGDNQVVIKTFKYGPKDITVPAGTTVTWINKDPEVHTVVSKDKKFRSSALDTDDTFTFTFTEPGTYSFFCSLHPQMTGTVTVVPKG
jgi:plastocyanin